jgi:hypothetical protein
MAARLDKTWHAVCVLPGAAACDAAHALRGRRFLSRDAPRLPLPDCNREAECQCKYQHLADRRGDPRRADDTAVGMASRAGSNERRRPGERRERRGK